MSHGETYTSKNVRPNASHCLGANATLINVGRKCSIELVLILNSRHNYGFKLLRAALIISVQN